MPLIATDTFRLSNLVKQEFWPEHSFCRDVVTVNEAAAKTYAVGTVLGKVTATGKYKICVQNAADGSQTPAAVVLQDATIPAATDTKLNVLVRGAAILSKSAIVHDASFNTDALKNGVYDVFAGKNILVVDTL